MTASVGGEAKDKEKETTPVEDAKPGVGHHHHPWLSNLTKAKANVCCAHHGMMCNVRCVYSVCVAGPVSTDQVILATGGYDHTIKFWAAHTGVCTRTLQHPDSQVSQTCWETRDQMHTRDSNLTMAMMMLICSAPGEQSDNLRGRQHAGRGRLPAHPDVRPHLGRPQPRGQLRRHQQERDDGRVPGGRAVDVLRRRGLLRQDLGPEDAQPGVPADIPGQGLEWDGNRHSTMFFSFSRPTNPSTACVCIPTSRSSSSATRRASSTSGTSRTTSPSSSSPRPTSPSSHCQWTPRVSTSLPSTTRYGNSDGQIKPASIFSGYRVIAMSGPWQRAGPSNPRSCIQRIRS